MAEQAPRIEDVEELLRRAAGMGPSKDPRPAFGNRNGFFADLGCGARVDFGHIDGLFVGSVSLNLRRLTPNTAEAVLNFLRTRNEPNSMYDR